MFAISFSVFSIKELSDLAANPAEGGQQGAVRLTNLMTKELHATEKLLAGDNGKRECRMQVFPRGRFGAREIIVGGNIGNPDRAQACPDTARQTHPTRERGRTRNIFELTASRSLSRPDFEALQNMRRFIDSPHRADFPFKGLADSLNDPGKRVIERRRLGQNPRYGERSRKMLSGQLALSHDGRQRQTG